MRDATITIANRFHGPERSGNGGYVCGRLARFIDGPARVRLYVPPPLDIALSVEHQRDSVTLELGKKTIAEAWAQTLELDIPEPPTLTEAAAASKGFRGFQSHRFATCFVCGRDRDPEDGLNIFAGPVANRPIIACTWNPRSELADSEGTVSPEFVWCALDCPGGFAFPEPEQGTILLGELTVDRYAALQAGRDYVVIGWELASEGRKHHTGTALFSADGRPLAAGLGIWFEVDEEILED